MQHRKRFASYGTTVRCPDCGDLLAVREDPILRKDKNGKTVADYSVCDPEWVFAQHCLKH